MRPGQVKFKESDGSDHNAPLPRKPYNVNEVYQDIISKNLINTQINSTIYSITR